LLENDRTADPSACDTSLRSHGEGQTLGAVGVLEPAL